MQNGLRRWILGFLVVVGVTTGVHKAQQQSVPKQVAAPPNFSAAPILSSDPAVERLHEQQVSAADTERHKRMVTDSAKLVELATALKQEVDKSTKNEMSVAVIKEATEIEKLAHEVKERMKGN